MMHPEGPQSGRDGLVVPAVGWMDRRAIAVFALMGIGYWTAGTGTLPEIRGWIIILLGVLAGVCTLFTRGVWCRIALGIAVVSIAAGWFRARCDEVPRDNVSLLLADDPRLLRVEGRVITTPELSASTTGEFARFERQSGAWHFDFQVSGVINDAAVRSAASGILRVRAAQEPTTLRAGERAVLRGFARAPAREMNPGEPDRLRLARQEHVSGSIHIASPEFITPSDTVPTVADRVPALWARFAEHAQALSLGTLAPSRDGSNPRIDEPTSLLRAMLLGQRDDELRDLSDAFTRVGLAHILSVSGMNLTLLAWFALMTLRLLGDHPRLEKLVIALLVAAYLVVVPAEAPIIRAAIMIAVFLLAEWGGRRYDRLNTLAWSAVLVLAWRPLDLWSPGFQLSYLGVGALITLAMPLRRRLFGEPRDDDSIGAGLRGLLLRLLELIKTGFAASLCAWVITTPTVLWHTGVVSPIGPIANMIVWPLVSAITGAGYAMVLAGTLVPVSASWAVPALHALGETLAWLVRLLDAVPGGVWYLPRISAAWCTAATVAPAWWMLNRPSVQPLGAPNTHTSPAHFARRHPWHRRQLISFVACVLLLAWLGTEAWVHSTLPQGTREIIALHLPGGGCTVLRGGHDAVLYDCGSPWGSAGRRLIPRALRQLGVASVHTAIISHADPAAYNALLDAARPLGVREVIVGEQLLRQAQDSPEGPAAYLLERLDAMHIKVRTAAAGDASPLGDAAVRVLAPQHNILMPTHRDASVVIAFEDADAGPTPALAAVLLGELARPGFEALGTNAAPANIGVILFPRTGWLTSHAEQVLHWAGSTAMPPSSLPITLMQSTPAGPHDHGLPREIEMSQRGCVVLRYSVGAGWVDIPWR